MESAFDLKDLAKRLTDNGLPAVEAAAKVAVEQVLNWIQESVILTPNKVDDLAAAVIPFVKPVVMAAIDKIDGKEG